MAALPNGRVEITPQQMALQSVSSSFPKRPNVRSKDMPESCGIHFPVLSNSFRCRLVFPSDEIAKYDVTFKPALPEDAAVERQRIIRSIRNGLEEIYGQIYLDNTRVYALRVVGDDQQFPTPNGGHVAFRLGQTYRPTDMDPQTQVQIASIMLQRILRDSNLLRLGRAHFEGDDQHKVIQVNTPGFCNLKLWPGYRISIEPAQSGLRLSVDVCHRVLETRSVRRFMDERWDQLYQTVTSKNPNMSEDAFTGIFEKNVKDELIGRAVLTLYNKRVWRVDDVDFKQGINDTFQQNDGNNISYKDYVKQRYNVDAASEFKGLLVNLPKMRKMDQGQQRQVFIIPELAYLTGYSKAMRSNRRLMKQISDQTRVPASIRWKMAQNVIERLNGVAKDQGTPLQISKEAEVIDGRIMQPYKIFLRKGKNCDITGPKDLQRNWARSDFMEQGAPLTKWAVVYEPSGKADAQRMVEGLKQQAQKARIPAAGFNPNPLLCPIEMRRNVPREKCWENSIRHNLLSKYPDVQGIFAVIPARANDKESEDIYSAIKRVCSCESGTFTQCVKGSNTGNKHVINGIFKQMFIKLGSIPWKVKFELPGGVLNLNVPTMLVGMDTNHDRKQKLSSCAMVASYDRDFVRYHTNVAYQQLGQEIIDHTKQLFISAMENFRKVNKTFPKQVIIYRDGVSNTQLEAVAKDEIAPIRAGLRQIGATDTKFLFVIVQKRIVARFINQVNQETVHPGTVISDTVTSSQFWDFFLVPCSPPPGCTATPTRFIVIEDGLGLSKDEKGRGMADLEVFTNQLCALYFNWPGAIRVPACVKYAYKLSQQFSQAMHSQGNPNAKLLLSYHFL